MRWPWSSKANGNGTATHASRVAVVPTHIAIIMDGNGRWAKERMLPRIEGHRAGAKTVRMVVEQCRGLGVRYLTLFSFSTENWLRPQDEVNGLMKLFCQYVESERDLLVKHEIRLRAIGDRGRLSEDVQAALARIEQQTVHFKKMDLILALSYGGRDELVNATRLIADEVKRGVLEIEQIDAKCIQRHLYAPDVPDPDLLVRTSDECRISNFLLWQLAYTELVVSKEYWPAFSVDEFHRCLAEFAARRRRFGLIDEQIEAKVSDSDAAASLSPRI